MVHRSFPRISASAAPYRPNHIYQLAPKSNPRFHEFISCFFARTGVPIVINTSFNDSESIVCTPTDAIVTFRKSGIDALFMDDVCLTMQG